MKLLLDENLSPNQTEALRSLGYDAVCVIEEGLAGAPDERVREHAMNSGRVLVTLDSDFANLLRFPTVGTPGVLRLKVHPPTESRIAEQLRWALQLLAGTNLADRLAVADGEVVRIRG